MSENYNDNLKELGKSDYEISEGQSDIRGWIVKNESGRILGKVNDLILDTQSKKIKYLILDTDGNELYLQVRKVLLPLEHTEIDAVYRNVIFSGLMANELSSLPTYEKGKIASNIEGIISSVFSSRSIGKTDQPDYPNKEQAFTETHKVESQPVQGIYSGSHAHTADSMKKQTAVGLFEYTSEAQSAVAYLKDNGFSSGDIEISYRDRSDFNTETKGSMSGFFSKLFNSEESNWLTSKEANYYSVVAVNNLSLSEAERAAEIFDKHGAVNIDDEFKAYRERHMAAHAEKRNANYRSRIITRSDNDRT